MNKSWRGIVCLLLLFATLGIGSAAQAADFRADEENPKVTGTIDDDVYVAGNSISVTGDISGELWAAGQDITMSGSTGGSMLAAAQDITVSGKVSGTARLMGQNIKIESEIEGDVMAAGQSVEITSDGSVERDLLVGAQELKVAGDIGGDIRGGAQTLTIAGTVNGDVEVDSPDVTLEAGARINGDLIYTSDTKADVDPGAEVTGRIVRRIPADTSDIGDAEALVLGLLRSIAGAFILGLVLMWLLPGLLPATSIAMRRSPLGSLGIGAAALILLPVVVILLFVIAAFIGAGFAVPLALLTVYAFLLLLSKVIVAFTLGALILRIDRTTTRPGSGKIFLGLLIGVVILAGLSLIPFVGGLIDLLVILFAMGASVLAFFHWRKGPHVDGDPAAVVAAPAPKPVPASTTVSAG